MFKTVFEKELSFFEVFVYDDDDDDEDEGPRQSPASGKRALSMRGDSFFKMSMRASLRSDQGGCLSREPKETKPLTRVDMKRVV